MRFTLITEGISENRIIKHILIKYFKEEEIFFRDAQPQIVNDKQETVGGWNEVLKFCLRKEDLKEIFNNTDYLVIQIDTDLSPTKPFDISHHNSENVLKNNEELYNEVVEKLKSLIDDEILAKKADKIIFAVCIHTIECWLLPLHLTNTHKSDIRNCISTLNTELRKQNFQTISPKNKNTVKSVKTYDLILKLWRKKDIIKDSAKHNLGFQKFVDSLDLLTT